MRINVPPHTGHWTSFLVAAAEAPATLVEADSSFGLCLLEVPNNEQKKFNFGLQTASEVESNLRFEIYG